MIGAPSTTSRRARRPGEYGEAAVLTAALGGPGRLVGRLEQGDEVGVAAPRAAGARRSTTTADRGVLACHGCRGASLSHRDGQPVEAVVDLGVGAQRGVQRHRRRTIRPTRAAGGVGDRFDVLAAGELQRVVEPARRARTSGSVISRSTASSQLSTERRRLRARRPARMARPSVRRSHLAHLQLEEAQMDRSPLAIGARGRSRHCIAMPGSSLKLAGRGLRRPEHAELPAGLVLAGTRAVRVEQVALVEHGVGDRHARGSRLTMTTSPSAGEQRAGRSLPSVVSPCVAR